MSKEPTNLHVTVTSGLRGYFAVLIGNFDGFPEPIQTSPITCKTFKEAEQDAKYWAKAEGIPYK